MTSTTANTLAAEPAPSPLISRAGWMWLGIVSALFVLLYWNFVRRMIYIATNTRADLSPWEVLVHIVRDRWNPDWSHVLVIPLISLYFVGRSRPQLARTPRRVFTPGLLLLFAGLLGFAWWIYPGRNDMGQGLSMIIALTGIVLFLLGPAMMRMLWFPIAYLIFFIKVSDRIWDTVALRLQGVAAYLASIVLKIFSLFIDFDVAGRGNQLEIGFNDSAAGGAYVSHGLEVAQACAGLRMLMAFVALGVAMAYLADRSWWQRLIMVLLAVPIAIAVNVGRVTMLGLLLMVNEEMTKGDFHTFLGMLMLIPAAGLFWLVGWVLDRLVVDEGGPARTSAAPDPATPVAGGSWDGVGTIRGGLAGVLLASLVGASYYLLLGVVQPHRAPAGPLLTWIALGGSLLLLLLVALGIRRAIDRGDRAGNPRPSSGGPSARTSCMALGIVVGVLATSVVGMKVVTGVNKVWFMKEPVDLRRPLYSLRQNFHGWQHVREDPPLPADQLDELGTRQYISYHYRDLEPDVDEPTARVRLHSAYYTGTVDTVPHVAERCFIGGGAVPHGKQTVELVLSGDRFRADGEGYRAACRLEPEGVYLPTLNIKATMFSYYPNPDARSAPEYVLYFFVANGKYLPNPDLVRWMGFNLTDRYSYYCKVEMGMGVVEPEVAVDRASRFLSTMLPEIMACLPDWQQLQRSGAAAPADAP